MATITVRGVELHYEENGEGRPIVFLHGVWMSGRFFERQLGPVGEQYRAISLDFRGHGRSGDPGSGHTIPEYAADVHAFLEELDLRDAVLVGWSMGAFVIWEYVKQFGCDRVAGTVVVDEAASDFAWDGWPHGMIGPEMLRDLNEGVQSGRAGLIDHFIPLMFKEEPSPEDAAWMASEMALPTAGTASSILLDQTLRDYREELPAVTVPTLVVVGGDEKLITRAAGEYLVERLPDARLLVFEESSHCPFLEETERFNAAICEFAGSLG
jgi:pimeloyl-ACP methyl ester carboxylesterase